MVVMDVGESGAAIRLYQKVARSVNTTASPATTILCSQKGADRDTGVFLHHDADALVTSDAPHHPANLICELCRKFYTLGWVSSIQSTFLCFPIPFQKKDPQFEHDVCPSRVSTPS